MRDQKDDASLSASSAVVSDGHRTEQRSFTEGRNTPRGPEVFSKNVTKQSSYSV